MSATLPVVDLRPGPSANTIRVGPVLVDTGSGTAASIARLRTFAQGAEQVALTHFHADHAGGVAALGLPVAAHEAEADTEDPRSGDPWLGFAIPPYRVDRALQHGDAVGDLVVIHTPGQTPGHVAYWHEPTRTAITGDLMQAGDVAWVPFGGPWADGALERMVESVRTLAALRPARCLSGHGRLVEDVPAAVDFTLRRYDTFAAQPHKAVWHAIRRALVSHLMIEPRSAEALADLPWAPVAAEALGENARAIVDVALYGLEERGVVARRGETWVTTLPHE
ncbi:glyoxylase-like metal-dependent hydrolase (beta-lactamase superfamily II) [Solirubrobacter pauli]|uniref:Glyoxylase-like metal-dependent hydrolase (Beta-lactamase superfamily II) n=1 Tax=Solirubrobacter pauli TaxID=166793 RepID=A0A660L2T9_9ACTN|nr:MBL fold metallo-hydrolase [Solirubrobacter pauli]RKQ87239.1 glyoxylase-like metal-dependent hydrolase (beta-lactamase superfamily II) [Solirubrobacter pauli]